MSVCAGCPNYQQGFEKGTHESAQDRYVCRDSNDDRIPLDLSRRNPGADRLLGTEWRKIGRNSAGWRRRSTGRKLTKKRIHCRMARVIHSVASRSRPGPRK